jgi:hypothetical protein
VGFPVVNGVLRNSAPSGEVSHQWLGATGIGRKRAINRVGVGTAANADAQASSVGDASAATRRLEGQGRIRRP